MVTKIHASMVTALEALVESKVAELSGGKIDIGDYVLSPAASKPKFLLCDGGAYNRTTYAALFGVIGTKFGAGDGSTTFNVPDSEDIFPLIAGPLHAIGEAGGEEEHILLESEMPSHTHTGTAASAGAHTHGYQYPGLASGGVGDGQVASGNPENRTTVSSGAHTHTLTINDAGGDGAHNNMPPFLVIGNLFIYAGV